MKPATISRVLRKRSTWAEKKLWAILRDRRFSAYKFRRQHKIGEYSLDLYCAEARYNLELDGRQHGFPDQRAKDKEREEYLRSRNIVTRRFWNSRLKDIRFVRDTIWADLQERNPHPGNEQPEKSLRLPTRVRKCVDEMHSHPSP